MRHGSLFSGGGGFDLAAEWMGWDNVFHCEKESFCRQILKYYWPNATSYENIITTDFNIWRGKVDILTGGFPCQTFSLAGDGEMDMSLWKENLRAIREVRPYVTVSENVFGFLVRRRGMAIEEVCNDLENEGYTVIPPLVLPAASVGACHRRYRAWIVAYDNQERAQTGLLAQSNKRIESKKRVWANPNQLFERPAPPAIRQLDDGVPGGLDGIPLSKWRTETLKMYGNSIVPQVAYEIFKAIQSTAP